MLVYVIVNLVEEKSYVGKTTKTLKARLKEHWLTAKSGATSPLHVAMRQYPDENLWLYAVLQNCYDDDQLANAESSWMKYMETCDPEVGYNVREELNALETRLRKLSKEEKKERSERFKLMSDDEKKEFFRECGRLGAKFGVLGKEHGHKGGHSKNL